mmetsp:Transcript_77207/g.184853  ORF Transcript_77207/g.184853 Transcript_77207/m.184853 type:complete len:340 (+) Transcript_77207:690-1709(+)
MVTEHKQGAVLDLQLTKSHPERLHSCSTALCEPEPKHQRDDDICIDGSDLGAWIQNVKHTLQLHPSGCDLRGRGGSWGSLCITLGVLGLLFGSGTSSCGGAVLLPGGFAGFATFLHDCSSFSLIHEGQERLRFDAGLQGDQVIDEFCSKIASSCELLALSTPAGGRSFSPPGLFQSMFEELRSRTSCIFQALFARARSHGHHRICSDGLQEVFVLVPKPSKNGEADGSESTEAKPSPGLDPLLFHLEALSLGVLRCKLSPSFPHRPAQSWRFRWKMWQEFLHLFVPRTILPPPCQLVSETIMFPSLACKDSRRICRARSRTPLLMQLRHVILHWYGCIP